MLCLDVDTANSQLLRKHRHRFEFVRALAVTRSARVWDSLSAHIPSYAVQQSSLSFLTLSLWFLYVTPELISRGARSHLLSYIQNSRTHGVTM